MDSDLFCSFLPPWYFLSRKTPTLIKPKFFTYLMPILKELTIAKDKIQPR